MDLEDWERERSLGELLIGSKSLDDANDSQSYYEGWLMGKNIKSAKKERKSGAKYLPSKGCSQSVFPREAETSLIPGSRECFII